MKNILILSTLLNLGLAQAELIDTDSEFYAVRDIAVMQLGPDGTFDVICSNGNREQVTDLDLELGNVCPNRKTSKPSGILSVQRIDANKYSVVCRNLKRVEATSEELMAGKVCAGSLPAIFIEDGRYFDETGSYCDQDVRATYDNKTITELAIKSVGCSSTVEKFLCNVNVCKGKIGSYEYKLEILNTNSYRFANADGSRAKLFRKK